MKNINALRLIKELVKVSPLSEIMDEKAKTEVLEFINVQIDIEEDVFFREPDIPGFEGTREALTKLTILK